jgi:iron complex outermembrane receptor protein
MRRSIFRSILLATVAYGVIASPAVAQSEQTTAGQVESVVVTAQRRSEDLQQTPVSVTAISPEQLESENIQNAQDLMQVTPGLQVSTQVAGDNAGSATFFLRGMGQERSGNGSEPAVGIYIDDFYYPTLEAADFQILDLQQVEVLRGPQGTLFGRNTIGGAIVYTTKKPDFDFSGFVQGTAGSYDRGDLSGVLNIPITDTLAVRLTAGTLNSNGYVRVQGGGPDAGATRAELTRLQVRYQPSDALTVDLSAQYDVDHLGGYAYTVPAINPAPGTLGAIWNSIPPGKAQPYNSQYASQCVYCQASTDSPNFDDSKFFMTDAIIQYVFSDALTVKSLTSWQRVDNKSSRDLDASPLPIFETDPNTPQPDNFTTAASQELQFSGTLFDKRANYVSGLYYYDSSIGSSTAVVPTMTVLGSAAQGNFSFNHVTNYSAYSDATYSIDDIFSVLGGIRYSEDRKDIKLSVTDGTATAAYDSGTFVSWTWRAGAKAQWTDAIMSYATISTGFRSGGFTNSGTDIFPFEPEKATSYEVGSRMDLLGGRLRLNPSIFYVDWTNIQVQSTVTVPTGVFIVLQNAAKATSYGGELEAEAILTDDLTAFGNLANLQIKYDSIGAANAITINSHFEHAPSLTYELGLRYRRDLFDGYSATATINWSWEGTQFSTPTDVDTLRLPSYGLLNLRVDFLEPEKHWSLGLFVTNLTDQVYYVGGVNFANNVSSSEYDLGRPRELGAELRYRF